MSVQTKAEQIVTDLVCVTGPISAGATTLAKRLAGSMTWSLALEVDVERESPFFALYNEQPTTYAFHNQITFLTQSAELNRAMRESTARVTVQDFSSFEHTEVYAYVLRALGTLSKAEYNVLRRLTDVLSQQFVPARVLVYRPVAPDRLLARIRERGRPSERDTDKEFAEAIRERFDEWVTGWSRSPVIHLKDDTDFMKEESAVSEVGKEVKSFLSR